MKRKLYLFSFYFQPAERQPSHMQYQQQGSYTQSADRAAKGSSRVVGAVGLCGPRISIETLSGVDAVIILNTGIGFLEHL